MISGKILKHHGWPDNLIRFAKDIARKLEGQGLEREAILARLDDVRQDPGRFLADPLTTRLARECMRMAGKADAPDDALRSQPLQYRVWGAEHIDAGALA